MTFVFSALKTHSMRTGFFSFVTVLNADGRCSVLKTVAQC